MGKKKAGCVPVRRLPHSDVWQVLLVQSRWTPAVWLFPKGGVEPGESPKAAAVRETCEEGGVVGDLGPKLGVWTFNRSSKTKQKMWLLFVNLEFPPDSKSWKERKKRRRAWHSFPDAKALLTDLPQDTQRPELLQILDKAQHVLAQIGSGPLPLNGNTSSDSPDDPDDDEDAQPDTHQHTDDT